MKKLLKMNLFSSLVLVAFLSYSIKATACPAIDIKNIPMLAGSNIATQATALMSNEVVIQEEISNKTRSGNASCANAPVNKKTELSTKTYDYLKKNIDEFFKSSYISPQEKYEDALKMLQEKFFVQEGDSESATTKLKNRMAFASEVAAEAYAISQAVRPLYLEDMKGLHSASGKGCNQTQSNAILNRNMKAQMKMLASQILIQIVQMETDVMQQFVKESPTILTLKSNQPAENKEGDKK